MNIFLIFAAYLIGSIPSGYLIARMFGIKDIRLHGSGNIGATNVARILGAKFFLIVFLADFLKAFLFLLAIQSIGLTTGNIMICGLALILGNGASIFLQFRGGKAVATSCGVMAFFNPWLLLAVLVPWLLVVWATHRIGIASGAAYCTLPFFAGFTQQACVLVPYSLLICVWGIFLHRSNIREFFAS